MLVEPEPPDLVVPCTAKITVPHAVAKFDHSVFFVCEVPPALVKLKRVEPPALK